jgi:hypothetical protein
VVHPRKLDGSRRIVHLFGSLRQFPRRRSFLIKCVPYILALLPLVAGAAAIIKEGIPDPMLEGDPALTELAVRAALSGEQWVGAYSRFNFNHPGPIYFYLLAPLYWLTHYRSLSFVLSVLLINSVAICMILNLMWRHSSPGLYLLWGMLFSQYITFFETRILSFWNPNPPVLLFILLILSLTSAIIGELKYLVISFVLASFVVQTHIGYLPSVVILMGSSLLLIIIPYLQKRIGIIRSPKGHVIFMLLSCILTLTLLWILPCLEEIRSQHGNFSKILAFFQKHQGQHSWGEVVRRLVGISTAYLWSFGGQRVTLFPEGTMMRLSVVIAVLLGALLLISFLLAKRHGLKYFVVFSILCGILLLTVIVSLKEIKGGFHNYVVFWMTSIGMFALLVIFGVLYQVLMETRVQRPITSSKFWSVLVLVLFAVCARNVGNNTRIVYKKAISMQYGYEAPAFLRQAANQILFFSKQYNIKSCYLKFMPRSLELGMPTIVACLTKANIRAFVDPDQSIQYPRPYLLSSCPEGMFLFLRPKEGESLHTEFPHSILVALTPKCIVLWNSFSSQPSQFSFSFKDFSFFTFKSHGFHQAERMAETKEIFRWSSGRDSYLVLALDRTCDYRLKLVVRPFLVPGKQQSLTLLFNSHKVDILRLAPKSEWQEFIRIIPHQYLREINKVSFRCQYWVSPRELGISDDKRVLGIAFKSMTFEKIQ